MMIGENNNRSHPTIHIPQWDPINDPTALMSPPFSSVNLNGVNDYPHSPSPYLDSFASLCRYLPSNDSDSSSGDESSLTDEFHMYEFKVRRCARGRSHDWTECPFAHPGEKARRRDPRKFLYSARYRTQPCKDGTSCRRKICFFAHTPEQLRILPGSGDLDLGFSSIRNRFESHLSKLATSPTSILVSPPFSPPSESPPLSPTTGELIASMRKMQLSGGCSWNSPMRSGLRLPFSSSLRPIPTQAPTWPRLREFDIWENEREEAPAMEFVESGRELRAKMYARLSRENSLG
ncbi:Zinc finger CCCH domain-containing protein 23 [Cardamine amara subsp. amara]|uniref:Zinc finger CCCH domain-containing protein 23 n=1 Tax=Cardamine amara subsp. amara TaxID=228776 RepID=A0ABD1C551_CARAN